MLQNTPSVLWMQRVCVCDSSHTHKHAPNLIISTILRDKVFLFAVVVGSHKFHQMTAFVYATVYFGFFFLIRTWLSSWMTRTTAAVSRLPVCWTHPQFSVVLTVNWRRRVSLMSAWKQTITSQKKKKKKKLVKASETKRSRLRYATKMNPLWRSFEPLIEFGIVRR